MGDFLERVKVHTNLLVGATVFPKQDDRAIGLAMRKVNDLSLVLRVSDVDGVLRKGHGEDELLCWSLEDSTYLLLFPMVALHVRDLASCLV